MFTVNGLLSLYYIVERNSMVRTLGSGQMMFALKWLFTYSEVNQSESTLMICC